MSRYNKYSSKKLASLAKHGEAVVENFMGGNSYKINLASNLSTSTLFNTQKFTKDLESIYVKLLSPSAGAG
jgi:hypothetical protein